MIARRPGTHHPAADSDMITMADTRELLAQELAIRPPHVLRELLQARDREIFALILDEAGRLREDRMVWRHTCPACRSKDFSDHSVHKHWPLARCHPCGLVFGKARLTAEAWRLFHANSDASNRFHRDVIEATRDKRAVLIDQPRARWVQGRFSHPGAILEIGCSTGRFLLAMRELGWRCHGIEPNPDAVRAAHEAGLTGVRCCGIETYEFPDRFDAACAFGVLGHVDDIADTCARIARNLKVGGRLFVTDVNFDGFYAAVSGTDYQSYVPPVMSNFITADVATRALRSQGFTDISLVTPGILDVVRVWNYWQDGGTQGLNPALLRIVRHQVETGDTTFQRLIVEAKASEHMWITAVWPG